MRVWGSRVGAPLEPHTLFSPQGLWLWGLGAPPEGLSLDPVLCWVGLVPDEDLGNDGGW